MTRAVTTSGEMNRSAFAVLASTMFISMMGFGVLGPLLPLYAVELGASGLDVGLIASSFGITNCLFLTLFGRLSDRYGRKIFLCIGLFCLTFVTMGFVWAKGPLHLIVLRALQGLASTMHLPVAQAYLGDMTPEGEEGRWMGVFNAVMFGGMGAGPLFGGVLNDVFGIESVFYSTAALNFLGLIATLIFLGEPEKKATADRPRLSLAALRENHLLRSLLLLRFTVGIGTAAVITFLPILASGKLLLGTGLIGIILASRTPVSVLQTYTGRLADRYDRKLLIVFGSLISVVFIAATPWVTGFWMLLIVHVFAATGNTISMPAATAYIVKAGRTFGMATSMSAFMLAMALGHGLGPLLLGGLADLFNVEVIFYAGAGINLLGVAIFVAGMRKASAAESAGEAPAG